MSEIDLVISYARASGSDDRREGITAKKKEYWSSLEVVCRVWFKSKSRGRARAVWGLGNPVFRVP